MTKKLTANQKVLNCLLEIREVLGKTCKHREFGVNLGKFGNKFTIYINDDYVTVSDKQLKIEIECFRVFDKEAECEVVFYRRFGPEGIAVVVTEDQILSSITKARNLVMKSKPNLKEELEKELISVRLREKEIKKELNA